MSNNRNGKIRKHVLKLIKTCINDLRFSEELARKRLLLSIIRYCNRLLHTSFTLNNIEHSIDSIVLNYLSQYTKNPKKKYSKKIDKSASTCKSPVFICWWDGEKIAPIVVKKCIASVKEHATNHPIYVIDKNNYNEFLDIPDYILDKVNNKHMNLAVLADYIRVALLSKYGGLWIDATVYVSKDIPEEYFYKRFYTVNGESAPGYIANGRWATYVIGGWKRSLLFKYVRDAFEFYWKDNEYAIDYFMIDYFIELAYRDLKTVRDDIDSLEINNPHRFELRDAMLRGDNQEMFEKNIYDDTCFNKLSWKANYKLKTVSGEPSVYEYWLSL